ncbi:MAG: hypothetical protein ACYCXT_11545 [Acidiferrobacteraceae bacterium]
MAINFTSNPTIFDDTVAFKNLLYAVFVANELGGNASVAYQLSPPATPGSGWSFGAPQYDLGRGTNVPLFQVAGPIPPPWTGWSRVGSICSRRGSALLPQVRECSVPSVQPEISKDAELLNAGRVQGVDWHFFQSPVTGLGGPSQPLLKALQQNGINVIIH